MSSIEVKTGGSSTYNSDGIYVSSNTFEELEEIFLLKNIDDDPQSPDVVNDPEAPEIIGIFDLPSIGSPEVEKWYGSKRNQLMDTLGLSRKITNLTSAERKQYDDHFEEVSNNFKSSLTEIDNIKGRYFLMDEPTLLNQSAENAIVLNPYIEYFQNSNDQWVGYNYSRNSYWSFLLAQNNFIDAIGNSRKPPSIEGAHENLANDLANSALDRKWKTAMINGSEFAQAILQSINDLVESGVNLEGYDLQIYHGNQRTSIFEALDENPSLGIIYASQAPGYSLVKTTGVDLDKMKAVALDLGGETPTVESSQMPIEGAEIEDIYDNFDFINYQVLAHIFSKWTDVCVGIYADNSNLSSDRILDRILGIVDSDLSLDAIVNELASSSMGDSNNCIKFYAMWPLTNNPANKWTPVPRNSVQYDVSSGFNINHGAQQKIRYLSNDNGTVVTSEYLRDPVDETNDYVQSQDTLLGALQLGKRETNDEFIDKFNPVSETEIDSKDDQDANFLYTSTFLNNPNDLIKKTSRLRHNIVWQWNSLYSIFNFIINKSIEKVYYSLLSQFGSEIGPLESFKSSIFSSWKGSSLESTLIEVLKGLPKSNKHSLESKADGRWNIISNEIQRISDSAGDFTGLAIYIATPGLEDITGLTNSFISFKKMLSSSTTLYLGDANEESIDSSIFPPQILSTYRKNNPKLQSPKFSIVPFNENYYDPMKILEGSYSIPNNSFWEMQIYGLSGADAGNQDKLIESWREIDRIEREARKSQNKLLEFTSTTLSSELTSLIKQKSIDLGFIFRNYNKWNAQREYLENILTASSFEQPSRKWIDLQNWLENKPTYSAALGSMNSGGSLFVLGLPYSRRYDDMDSYTLYVDGEELSGEQFGTVDSETAKYILHIIYGVDTSIENFPADNSWNIQYYSDPVLKNEVGLFDWSPEDFKDNRQIKQVDSRWNIFPFLFPEMAYSQMTIEKKYEKIVYLMAPTSMLEGDIKIAVSKPE